MKGRNKVKRRSLNKRWSFSAWVTEHRDLWPASKAFRERRGTRKGKHKR